MQEVESPHDRGKKAEVLEKDRLSPGIKKEEKRMSRNRNTTPAGETKEERARVVQRNTS